MKKVPFVIVFIMALCVQYSAHNRWRGNSWKVIIGGDWDGYGYYAYLPAVFMNHSLDFTKVMDAEKKFEPGMPAGDVFLPFPIVNGRFQDKYCMGVAILLTPFFLLAYFLSFLMGYDLSGYSFLFQLSVNIAALFYVAIGLYYLRKLLLEYDISKKLAGLVLVLTFLGTNVFYYATLENSISHIYSFSIACVFLYSTKRSISQPVVRNLLRMAIVLGLLIIIRPTNILIIGTIPFLAGSFADTKLFLESVLRKKNIIWVLLPALAMASLQCIMWYCETGRFFIWSYYGEGFNFNNPHITDLLFSYRKGWFLYTPLMLVVVVSALIVFFKENIFRFGVLSLFLCVVIYILSCWYQWWYGGSFSLRPMVEFYPFLILAFAMALKKMKPLWVRLSVTGVCVLCLVLNLIQTYQYKQGIILFDKMDKKTYWSVFLKTDNPYLGFFGGLGLIDSTSCIAINCNMEKASGDSSLLVSDDGQYTFRHGKLISHTEFLSGASSVYLTQSEQFGMEAELKVNPGDFVHITVWRKSMDSTGVIVLSAKNAKQFYAGGKTIVNTNKNGWLEIEFKGAVPENYKEKTVGFYLFYPGNKEAYFDDLSIKIYHAK